MVHAQGLLTRGHASGEDDGTMTYLVKLVLAPLGVIDGGAVPVLEKVSCRDEPVSACEGASASAMLRLRGLGGGGSVRFGVESGRGEWRRLGLTIVSGAAGYEYPASGAEGVDFEDCMAGVSIRCR